MKKKSTTATFDENAPFTQGDIDAGTLVLRKRAAGGSVVLPKKRVTLYLDATLVERFNVTDCRTNLIAQASIKPTPSIRASAPLPIA